MLKGKRYRDTETLIVRYSVALVGNRRRAADVNEEDI